MSDNIPAATKPNQRNTNGDCKRYESALALKFYEGQISWQMNVLFVGLNIGIGTIIQNKLQNFVSGDFLLIIMSIVGITINFFWLGSFRRNNKYYHFRMAQAREAEPRNWNLLKNRGYKFSKGRKINIDGEGVFFQDREHQLSYFEIIASNKRAIGVAIWSFISCFILLFLFSVVTPLFCLCK